MFGISRDALKVGAKIVAVAVTETCVAGVVSEIVEKNMPEDLSNGSKTMIRLGGAILGGMVGYHAAKYVLDMVDNVDTLELGNALLRRTKYEIEE